MAPERNRRARKALRWRCEIGLGVGPVNDFVQYLARLRRRRQTMLHLSQLVDVVVIGRRSGRSGAGAACRSMCSTGPARITNRCAARRYSSARFCLSFSVPVVCRIGASQRGGSPTRKNTIRRTELAASAGYQRPNWPRPASEATGYLSVAVTDRSDDLHHSRRAAHRMPTRQAGR